MNNHQLEEQDYSIYGLIRYFWIKRIALASITFAVMVLVAIWTLTIENTYLSDAKLSPTEEASGGGLGALSGQLGGLASLAGLSVEGGGVDQVTEALAILKSRYFSLKFIKKHGLEVALVAAQDWDEATRKLIIDDELYDSESEAWIREVAPGRAPEPTNLELYEAWQNVFLVEKDAATGLVNMSIEYLSPDMAYQWLDWLISDINEEMRQREIAEAKSNIRYLEGKVESIDNIDMRNVFFQLILEQTKSLMLAEVRDEFIFKVIDPPVVPEKRFAPNRTLICLGAGFLTVFLLFSVYSIMFLILPRK